MELGSLVLCVLVLYFPPRPNKGGQASLKQWVAVSKALIKFASEVLESLPQRCTPLLFTDLNSGLKPDDELASMPFASVGKYCSKSVNETGRLFLPFLEDQGLCVANTFFP